MQRRTGLLLLCMLAFVFCAAGARAENEQTDNAILIGIANVQDGPAQFLGVELNRGARACFNAVNESGGIAGRHLTIMSLNDGYEPDRCIEATRRLLHQDKAFLLFNYVGTPTTKAVLDIVTREQVPFFFPFTGAAFLRDTANAPTVFNLRASYDMETRSLVEYLLRKGRRRIAIFYQDDSYGRAGLQGVKAALSERNLSLVAEGVYLRNTTAVNQGLLTIRKANPEAVIMIGTYKPCAEFIKRARRLGMNDVDFLNISFVGSEALARELGSDGEGVIVSQVVPLPWNVDIAGVRDYQQALKRSFPDDQPGFVSLEGYLNARLLVEILRRSGDPMTRRSVIEAAENLNDVDIGLGEPVSFSALDHQGLDKVYLTRITGGKFVSL